jgi:hypothetical protein
VAGAEVVGVCMDSDPAAAREAFAAWGGTFRSGIDGGGWDGPAARAYGVRYIPRCVLVGPDGRIRARAVPPEWLLDPGARAGE